ncbi:MAG: mannitol-/sugar-/sorbitol-6-phosphatase [Gaiellales bacterium]|nr:mannitol-/sugar-/sorbitol-6-phosphatase [Gaiellales bacterium]
MSPPLLFDLDGTLVDSRVVVERHWSAFCERNGLDFAAVLAVLHGVRSVDTIRAVAPHLDAPAEAARLDEAEEADTDGLVRVAGAGEVLARLPEDAWGIVTSGHRTLAERRLRALALPIPAAMVCGDEIQRGKPDPEGFVAGARLLGAQPEMCVAFEDAPAGILAARAAGMPVVGITTTHEAAALAGAAVVIADLTEFDAALARAARRSSGGTAGAPR